jgi:hypothetical protein
MSIALGVVNSTPPPAFSKGMGRRRSTVMTERSYQEAVQVLRERLGTQLAGAELEGRGEMKHILKRELNYSDQEADDAIDAMLASGQLRYQRPGGVAATVVALPAAAATGEAISSAPELTGLAEAWS